MRLSSITGFEPEKRSFQKSDEFPTNDFIGLEIEIEGWKNGVDFYSDFWKVKRDDSLRDNGMEFVFKMPLNGVDISEALREFSIYVDKYEKVNKLKVSCSERSSVHAHLDVRDFDTNQLFNLGILYATFEPFLFKNFGVGREDSNYCLPLYKSSDKIRFSKLGCRGIGKNTIFGCIKSSKYSSFNTSSIFNFGSVEFRMHYGTTDENQIKDWIRTLLYMKRYAKNMSLNVQEFSKNVSRIGYNQFVFDVFEDHGEKLVYPGCEEDLIFGVRVAQDMSIRSFTENIHTKRIGPKINGNKLFNKLDKKFKKEDIFGPQNIGKLLKTTIGVEDRDLDTLDIVNWLGLEF